MSYNSELQSNNSDLQAILDKVNSLPSATEPGGIQLPTLNNPGAADDLLEGAELIDQDGNIITGNLYEVTEGSFFGATQNKRISADSTNVAVRAETTGEGIIRKGATLGIDIPLSDFGNATAAQVAKGATFTSESGLLIEGAHNCESGVELPELTNPGTAADLMSGKELIDANGNIITGEHVCSGGVELPTLDNPGEASDAVEGAEFIDASGNKITGTIAKRGASDVITNGSSVSVPAGYYETAVATSVSTATQATPSISLDETTGEITVTATQSAGYVPSGTKTVTKQMEIQETVSVTPGTEDQVISAGKYLTGDITVRGDSGLTAENIKSGVTIFNVDGTFEQVATGQYCWEKYDVTVSYKQTSENCGTTKPSDCGSSKYSSYEITDDGYFLLISGTSYLGGYYLPTGGTNGQTKCIYYEKWGYSSNTYYRYTLDDTPTQEIDGLIGYVTSDDINAYPENGIGEDGELYVLYDVVLDTLSVTENGTYTPPEGVDGYSQITVNVVSENDSYEAVDLATPVITLSTSGRVTATLTQEQGIVAGGTTEATLDLDTKEAEEFMPGTENQTIAPNLYTTGTQTILGDENLVPENIKSDVSIFGVTGTYAAELGSYIILKEGTEYHYGDELPEPGTPGRLFFKRVIV